MQATAAAGKKVTPADLEKLQEALKNKKDEEARRIKAMLRHEAERKQ